MYKVIWNEKVVKRGNLYTRGDEFKTDHAALSHVEHINKAARVQDTNTGAIVATYSPMSGVTWHLNV